MLFHSEQKISSHCMSFSLSLSLYFKSFIDLICTCVGLMNNLCVFVSYSVALDGIQQEDHNNKIVLEHPFLLIQHQRRRRRCHFHISLSLSLSSCVLLFPCFFPSTHNFYFYRKGTDNKEKAPSVPSGRTSRTPKGGTKEKEKEKENKR